MNSRERVLTTLRHEEPDRVPFDLGGTVVTGIAVTAYRRLREYLGMPEKELQIEDQIQQLAKVDDDMVKRLKVDVRPVAARSSAVFNLDIEDRGDHTFFYDEWGIGWKMPKHGFYYDMVLHPMTDYTSVQDLDRYNWPDPSDPQRFVGMKEKARRICEEEGRAVVLGNISAGFSETASWLMGYESYYTNLVANLDLVCVILDRVMEIKAKYWELALSECGDSVDVAMEAEDLASQHGMIISPQMYRQYIKPRQKLLYDFIKKQAPQVYIFFHSCGAIREIIPDLIEIGVDIINPVQVSAAGMDSKELKRDFGKDITFWGGGVDTQQVLDRGTLQEVKDEVKRRIDDLASGGGFVFNTVHNIQANVPPENLIAMWETLQEYGVYK